MILSDDYTDEKEDALTLCPEDMKKFELHSSHI